MKPGWTCGSWRPNWANATSPTRATTAAGKCLPRRTLCLTRLTWFLLPQRRPPTTRRAGRTPTCSASQRESASSDHRRTNGLTLAQKWAGRKWSAPLRDNNYDRKKKYSESNRKKQMSNVFQKNLNKKKNPKQMKLPSCSMKSSNFNPCIPAVMNSSQVHTICSDFYSEKPGSTQKL